MVHLTCDENALRVAYTGEFQGIRAMESHMRNLIGWSVTSTPIRWNQEHELSDEGFIGLTFLEEWNQACFLSAFSVQRPQRPGPTG